MNLFRTNGSYVHESPCVPAYFRPQAPTGALCVVEVPGGWALERVEIVPHVGRVTKRLPGVYATEAAAEKEARSAPPSPPPIRRRGPKAKALPLDPYAMTAEEQAQMDAAPIDYIDRVLKLRAKGDTDAR